MRKLSLFVVFVLVLSLLVAVSTPVSAGKPNPSGEKAKKVPPGQSKEKKQDKQTPPGQAKPDKPGNAGSVVAPDDAPEPVEPAEVESAGPTVVICHKPGTPAEQTLILPESAVDGHMRHGDREGPCVTQSPIQSPTVPITLTVMPVTPTLPMSPTAKISICHKPGTPAEKTLLLPASAIPGHLGHGDVLGPCSGPSIQPTSTPPITPTAPVTPSLVPTATQWISICHKPGTPAEKTLLLPESAIPGHLGHGDTLGSCPGAAAPPTSTVPTTGTVSPTSTVPITTVVVPTSTLRILICHKPGTAAEKTLAVPAVEVPEHLAHFDTLGACQAAPSITWATELIVALTQWFMDLFV
jgi:hypothetical protein